MSETSLFDRAGGVEGVAKLVESFYAKVLDDPGLAPFFAGSSLDKLQRMQTEFFSAALGGPMVYSGRSIREVHAGRGIRKEHLQKFVEHLLETLRDFNLDENDINAIYSRIAAYADDITGETTVDG